jgi:hypothetical protein
VRPEREPEERELEERELEERELEERDDPVDRDELFARPLLEDRPPVLRRLEPPLELDPPLLACGMSISPLVNAWSVHPTS